ncbi:MAG: hypothetical protein AAFX02_09445 [Pseudomonadota bacterium]
MSLKLHPISFTLDTLPPSQSRQSIPPPAVPIKRPDPLPARVELYIGDITAPGALGSEDILVISANPSETLVGSSAIQSWLSGLGWSATSGNAWFSLAPSRSADIYFGGTTGFGHILEWNPKYGPLTPQQAAPYRTDDIFFGAQAIWGHTPKSIMIPVTSGSNGWFEAVTIFRSLLHSALKVGGWRDYVPSAIKFVIDKPDKSLTDAFDAIATNYDGLRGAPNKKPGMGTTPANMPNKDTTPFSHFRDRANSWMASYWSGVKDINPITEMQAYAINIYTDDYFHPIQCYLRNSVESPSRSVLPDFQEANFTDLNNPDYIAMIPYYAVLSAGLLNISAFHGTTFRGLGGKAPWAKFTPGSKVRVVSYMSSADEFASAGLPWMYSTNPPWKTTFHIRTQSQTARDISPYSWHPYEREHLYDFGFSEYVTSHEPRGLTNPGNPGFKANFATSEIPRSLQSLV